VSDKELMKLVIGKRIEIISKEVGGLFPDAKIRHTIDPEGRGVISVTMDGYFLSQEFVETELSCDRPERWTEYLKVLGDRMRLVIVVPESRARSMRLKMLEFNRWWLFCYLVFSYDDKGNVRMVGRPLDEDA
jgi:hypothetical protein